MRFMRMLEKDYEGRYCLRRSGIQYCEADFIRWLNDTMRKGTALRLCGNVQWPGNSKGMGVLAV